MLLLLLQGMCTPSEVFVAVAAEGYQVSYRRVPMSRERTPQVRGWVGAVAPPSALAWLHVRCCVPGRAGQ